MSDVVNELLKGGTVDSRGVFTVDSKKAQEKLERFRLADPLAYVVELVQAAGLCGATVVDVEVTASLFRLRFDGRTFSGADLTDLESAVLVRNDVDHPARQQLALGVSAARALNPRFVSVQSEKTKLVVDDGGSSRFTTHDELAHPYTTVIEVQESFRIGHFVEFFQGAFGMQKEERMLADRCRHARFKVSVNGVVVSGTAPPCELQVDVVSGSPGAADRSVAGSFGFRLGSHDPGRLLLLRAGVVQETVLFADEPACKHEHVPRGYVAVVDAAGSPRDASFARFIRDDAFNALLQGALLQHRKPAALLVDVGHNGSVSLAVPEDQRTWAHAVARDVLTHLGHGARSTNNKRLAGLRSLPLLIDALGKPLSVQALVDDVERHGHAGYVITKRTALHLKPPRPVLLIDDVTQAWLARLGVPLRDISPAVEEAEKRELSQSRFRSRRSNCTLPSGSWIAQARFDTSSAPSGGAERGVIGFREHGGDHAQIVVVVDGCELAALVVPFAVPGLTIVVEGPFTPTFHFDDVVRNAALSHALVRAAGAIPMLFEGQRVRNPDGRQREALMACLGLFLDGNVLANALLEAAGCPKVPVDLPVLDADHNATTARLFRTMTGDDVSIEVLQRGEGPIGVVAVDAVDFVPSLRPTLRSGEVLRAVLRKVVPDRPLVSLNDEATQAKRRIELRGRMPDRLSVADVSASVPVSSQVEVFKGETSTTTAVSGFVGHRPGAQRGKIELAVFCQGRRLQVVKLPAPVSGLVASLNDDKLELTGKLQPLGDVDHLADAALAAVPKLVGALGDPWPLVGDVVSCLIPTEQHRKALVRLQANLPAAELGPAWREVLLLSTVCSDGDVAAALEMVLAESEVPTLDRLIAIVGSKKTPATTDARTQLLIKVLDHKGDLIARLIDVFELDDIRVDRLDGSRVAFSELIAAPALRSVPVRAPLVSGFGDVVVMAAALIAVVKRLRDGPIVDASDALALAAAQLAFERKQHVEPVLGNVETLARLSLDDDGLRGEVGLLAGPGSAKPLAELVLLHKGKHLVRLAIGQFMGCSLLAVVDADDVTPTSNFDGVVHDAKLTRVIERVRSAREVLVDGLVDIVEAEGEAGVEGGRLVVDFALRARLLERLRVSHPDRKKPMPKAGLGARIADLVFFPTLAGVPVALRDQEGDEASAAYVPSAVKDPPPGFEHVIAIERAAERELMEKLVDLDDVAKGLAAAARLHETRKRLPPLSFDIIDNGLIGHSARIGRADLRLGLPRIDPAQARLQIRVGHEGLLVETLGPITVPCNAVVQGDNVVAKDMRSARVDDKLMQSIAREAAALWTKAIDQFNQSDNSDEDRQALRLWLRHGALLFVDADVGKSPGWLTALRMRLLDVRAFPLDGGFISLNTAIQEQPPAMLKLLRLHGLVRAAPVVPVVVVPEPRREPPPPPPPPVAKKPEPEPEPEPPPPPPPPTDSERLQERLISIIKVVRERAQGLTSDLELHRLRVAASSGKLVAHIDKGVVVVDVNHPLCKAALESGPALAMVASLVVTRINDRLESVTDDDERRFLTSLIAHARTLEE
ncbi:MAG: HD domain-containing protein [Deltaproteobacteria bacterium]|nr:HD domain-containing protein [Deltaproteobacteria bacterium]